MSFSHEKREIEPTGSTSRLSGTTVNRLQKGGESSPFSKRVGETSSFAKKTGETSSFARTGEKKIAPQQSQSSGVEEKKTFLHQSQEQKKMDEYRENMGDSKEGLFKDRLGKTEPEKKEFSLGRGFSESSKLKMPSKLPTPLSGGKSDKFSMPLFQGSLSSNASSNISPRESLRVSKESASPALSFSSFLERKKELKNQNQEEDKSEI